MRRTVKVVALTGLLLVGAGCSVLPSWLAHPFGTPVAKAAALEKKVQAAEDKIGDALQEEVHEFNYAVDEAAAGNKYALQVAQSHARVARSLVDQLKGPVQLQLENKWQDLIARQTASDDKIRQLANSENQKRVDEIAKLSKDLEQKTTSLDEANKKVADYALRLQAFHDRVVFWLWIAGGLVGFYFLGQILALAAHFNPAFAPAAALVNTFVSPCLHSLTHKAAAAAEKATA